MVQLIFLFFAEFMMRKDDWKEIVIENSGARRYQSKKLLTSRRRMEGWKDLVPYD